MTSNQPAPPRRASAATSLWAAGGWTDSSWDLQQGLDVIEDLPYEWWLTEPQQAAQPPAD